MITLSFADAPVRFQYTAKEAVLRYIELRLSEGMDAKGDTLRHIKKHLEQRFCGFVGHDTPLALVRADHLREWGRSLRNDDTGEAMSLVTVRKHLIDVKTFFKRSHAEGWIDSNPSVIVALPPVEEKDPNLITAFDAFNVFKANREHPATGRLALEAFGGIRYKTAGKLVKDDIKFSREGIEMPSNKHKSTKRKYRQGQPANCWAWLRHAPAACWDMTLRQYADEKKDMCIRANMRASRIRTLEDMEKVKALRNVWRHSFASYLLALKKNYEPVRYLMQHAKATTTEIYEGRADEFEAYLYFGITPTSVLLDWEAYDAQMRLNYTSLQSPPNLPSPPTSQ